MGLWYICSLMRVWIAALLLCLFAFQALPVREVGNALTKAKISLSDNLDDDGKDAGDDFKVKKEVSIDKECTSLTDFQSIHLSEQCAQQITLHRPDHLPVLYAGEVLTPPPNRS